MPPVAPVTTPYKHFASKQALLAAIAAGALPRATPSAWHHCYGRWPTGPPTWPPPDISPRTARATPAPTTSSTTCSTTSRTPRRRPRNNQSSVRLARLDGLLQDLVARPRLRGDGAEPSGLVVLERPQQLLAGVHHEGTVGGDRLADRQAAEHQHVQLRAAALLPGVRAVRHHITRAVDGELAHPNRPPLGTNRTRARQHVHQRIEVRRPRQPELGARGQGGVQQADRGVRDAGALVPGDLAGDHAQQRATVGRAEQRHRAAADVLIARRRHLQPRREVDPELEPVEQAAALDDLLRRCLDVKDPSTSRNPLQGLIGFNPASPPRWQAIRRRAPLSPTTEP